jgi:lipoate-protein ligase A
VPPQGNPGALLKPESIARNQSPVTTNAVSRAHNPIKGQEDSLQPWRLLDLAAYNASANMAIDEAMLRACAHQKGVPATIRFYTWSPAAVSIGCLQRISGNFDLSQAKELGLDAVRRPTGGRVVLHKGDLTYSLVFAEDNPIIPRGIPTSYQKINQAVQRGLRLVGIPAQLCLERKISRSPFCFSGVAQYEILVHGKKIMGNAQKREKGACLQQGSIMVEDQQELIRRLFLPSPGYPSPVAEGAHNEGVHNIAGENEGAHNIAEEPEFISVEKVSGSSVPVSLIRESLIRGFEEVFHISFISGSLTGWEEEEAARLIQEKYSQEIWNKEGQV